MKAQMKKLLVAPVFACLQYMMMRISGLEVDCK